MSDDPRDPAGGVQSGVGPALAGVRRAVDPVAERDVAPDVGLAGADPHDVRIGGGYRDRPHREHGLVVEDRSPVDSAVGRLEHPAGGRAEVVGVRVSGNSVDRRNPVPDRADVPPAEGVEAALGGEGRGSDEQGKTNQDREFRIGEVSRIPGAWPSTPEGGAVKVRDRRPPGRHRCAKRSEIAQRQLRRSAGTAWSPHRENWAGLRPASRGSAKPAPMTLRACQRDDRSLSQHRMAPRPSGSRSAPATVCRTPGHVSRML